ncbi:MAG: hypothetical protein HY810_01565 [Candidatus Omnitrophica bacterium]|nr:hypothetical protein [Candidatus Omnitrophota bacterium]
MESKNQNSEKVTYEIDPYNRLIINRAGKESGLSRFRQVLDGRFKVDENNTISYLIKAPTPQGMEMPYQVKLEGKWTLDKDHNLCIELNKWGREILGDKLTLQADIIGTAKNSIAFSLTTHTKDNTESIYILELKGAWSADKNNRLTFRVQKEKGCTDILTFRGAWEINPATGRNGGAGNHQIIYQYEKARLITKKKQINTLIFQGYWDIKDKGRISYVLDARSDSVFNFKASAGIFKDKYIKYEVGIGGGKAQAMRTLTLFGKWKIKKNIGLMFEVEYENKEIHSITFGAEAKLTSKDSISFELKNERNKNISAQVQLSREILDGEGLAFLRFLKSKDESVVTIGAGLRW